MTGGPRWETYTLREINVDPMVVDEHSLHLEIGLLAVLLILELDKRILQAVASAFISYNLARQDSSKPAEDQM